MAREKLKTLSEQMFYILICLNSECCGVDIMKMVSDITGGEISIGPGTLYSLLDSFVKEKMIVETKVENRRKSYIITPLGGEMLQREYERISRLQRDYEATVMGGHSHENHS